MYELFSVQAFLERRVAHRRLCTRTLGSVVIARVYVLVSFARRSSQVRR